jgi:hypothetical protein
MTAYAIICTEGQFRLILKSLYHEMPKHNILKQTDRICNFEYKSIITVDSNEIKYSYKT